MVRRGAEGAAPNTAPNTTPNPEPLTALSKRSLQMLSIMVQNPLTFVVDEKDIFLLGNFVIRFV